MDRDFDEVLATDNTCRDGFYASTIIAGYKKHMRVFVTVPYSVVLGAINREYVGEVTRVESLSDGRNGIAIHLLQSVGLSARTRVFRSANEASRVLWRIPDKRTR
jgi:hypothetical protein